jgi:hypothetical protein
MIDSLLETINTNLHWSLHVSRPTSNPESYEEYAQNYIMLTWELHSERNATRVIEYQLREIHRARSVNSNALFLIVVCSRVSQPPKQLALRIFKEMWHSYKITNVLLVIPHFNATKTYMSRSLVDQKANTEAFDLYTWYPYSLEGNCADVNSINLIDKWLVKNTGEFLFNANLFPNKISGDFQGCAVKVATHIFPPIVIQLDDSNKKKYGGLELNVLLFVLEKLNLSIEYKVIDSMNKLNFESKTKLVDETAFGETDISIGGLVMSDKYELSADFTVAYAENVMKWYVPCAKLAPRCGAIFNLYSSSVWFSFFLIGILVAVMMRLLATHVKNYHFRESHSYQTFQCCLYIVWAIAVGVCAPAMPKTSILRIFVFVYLCYSFALNIIFQSSFSSFLVNPGSEKQISSVKDILDSGIEYGYSSDTHIVLKYADESEYRIMQEHWIRCEDQYQCFDRFIKNENFACISNEFFVEYLRMTTELGHAKREVCTLSNDIARISSVMYLKKANPFLNQLNKIIRRMTEAGLKTKWKDDLFRRDRIRALSSVNNHNHTLDSNNVDDNNFEGGYFVFSLIHLQIAFHVLFLGFVLSSVLLIGEILYQRFEKCGTRTTSVL